jgi:DNA-binding CsgD family transcriptional regulator
MFISAPGELPSRLQAVIEGFVDGILILTELGAWVHANATAQQICRQLTIEPLQPHAVPKEVWRVCWSLIDSRERFPEQRLILESEVTTRTGTTVRIRAQWLEAQVDIKPPGCQQDPVAFDARHYLLVVLEDRCQSMKNLAASNAKKYGLTRRQAQVWTLRQAGHSYQEIAAQLYITLNTVKKHIKDINAKILEVQQWEDYTDPSS